MPSTRPAAASFRLGAADLDLIDRLAKHLTADTGVPHTKTDVLRAALHQLSKQQGVTSSKKNAKKPQSGIE